MATNEQIDQVRMWRLYLLVQKRYPDYERLRSYRC